jgi:heterodisulfide reductase subunit A-like polyferredoxin
VHCLRACAEKCPKKVDDAFNMGINKRKAAYIKYGQAVPLKYAIDPNKLHLPDPWQMPGL